MLLDESHFYLEVLNEHVDCVVVFLAEGNDEIGVLHGRLDKVIVSRLHKSIVLGQHVNYRASAVGNVSLNLNKEISFSIRLRKTACDTYFYEPVVCHLESGQRASGP